MDFGVVGFDGMVGSDVTTGFGPVASDPVTKQKWYGFAGFLKQERSGNTKDDCNSAKMAKIDDFSASKTMLLQQRNNTLLRSNSTLFDDQHQQQEQMLSFASPKSDVLSADRNSESATLPYYHLTSSANYRNTGYSRGSLNGASYSCGSLNGASMHLGLTGSRGPFTPSQWMEFEHQALIYKYITANVPIPSTLLIPIRKAIESTGFSGFPGALLRPNTLGWSTFHLGFNNTDSEPGRCRRTDGKKWRCSRDAVADQKYCERHMNRGRHRSRKPVEVQSGHSVAAVATSTTSKLIPSSSSMVMGPTGGGGASSNLLVEHQQKLKNLQVSCASNPSASTAPINRMFLDKVGVGDGKQDTPGFSILPPTIDFKLKENSFPFSKQQIQFEESSRPEFGLVSDSLLHPSHRSPSLLTCRNFSSSLDLSEQETKSQHSLRLFMDEWPRNQPNRTSICWPEIDMQSDRTQLSISIPVTSSDFMSTSSPNNDKLTLSPLRLSCEFDPIQMGLGVGSFLNEPNLRQTNWIPIPWETSMGGPLGEVLHNTNTNNSTADRKNSSMLNLTNEDWVNSPRLSPTGVLQKTAFGSLSNSSAGSSPRAETSKAR